MYIYIDVSFSLCKEIHRFDGDYDQCDYTRSLYGTIARIIIFVCPISYPEHSSVCADVCVWLDAQWSRRVVRVS